MISATFTRIKLASAVNLQRGYCDVRDMLGENSRAAMLAATNGALTWADR